VIPSLCAAADLLKCAGSRTATHVVEPLAKSFDKADVIVIGGHTGDGFKRLFADQTDIVMASRRVKEKEKAKARESGIELVENQIGYSPIMIAVSPANSIDSLTLDEVKAVFTGAIRNWKQLGGDEETIEVLALDDPSSGTVAMFREKALGGGEFYDESIRVARLTTALKAVAKRPYSICFCRPGDMKYHKDQGGGGIKILGLRSGPEADVHTPDEKYRVTEDYPLNRPLFLYYDKKADNPLIKEFCDYCVSETN
jgi:phosphate transport system substrate-binding protein